LLEIPEKIILSRTDPDKEPKYMLLSVRNTKAEVKIEITKLRRLGKTVIEGN